MNDRTEHTRREKTFDKINMDTVVSSMGPGEIAVVAIGCGLGALLVGSVGAPFSSNFYALPAKTFTRVLVLEKWK